ncbi:MAG: ATP-dependent zinc protease [Alphaproteobacteria bacterium]|nr:ATP-dependent zinc protease [Alphaproteobacteria bacterium]
MKQRAPGGPHDDVRSTEVPGPQQGRQRKHGKSAKLLVGWREWVDLPDLGISGVKAKLDTGARTSALHVSHVRWHDVDGKDWVEFDAHPVQFDDSVVHRCWARAIDRRWVTNPGGRREKRFVIRTRLKVRNRLWPIELSLTNRDDMDFRLLLGRAALQRRVVLDPHLSYHTGRSNEMVKREPPAQNRGQQKRQRKSDEEE